MGYQRQSTALCEGLSILFHASAVGLYRYTNTIDVFLLSCRVHLNLFYFLDPR